MLGLITFRPRSSTQITSRIRARIPITMWPRAISQTVKAMMITVTTALTQKSGSLLDCPTIEFGGLRSICQVLPSGERTVRAIGADHTTRAPRWRKGRRFPGETSFPLDRAGRLRRDVERNAVHAGNLVDDAARDRLEQVVGQARPVGGHRVLRGHCPDHDRVRVGPLVALDAHRADRRQHGERLPQLAVEPGTSHLLLQDRVGLAQDLEPLVCDLADDPVREPWAREGLAPDHSLR